MKDFVPLWIIAATLSVMVVMMLSCAGWFFVVLPVKEHLRREELLRKEPWRQHFREPYKYAE